MPRRRPRQVFLSHASTDRRFVRRLARALSARGIRAWYSEHNLVGAQQWHDEIGKALGQCDWFIVVLSPQAVASEWVKRELLFALQARRYRRRIVPLLHRACDWGRLSWTLDSFQRVDFTHGFEYGCKELLRIWDVRS